MGSPPATNESFEVKRVQELAAACCSPLMYTLGGVNTPSPDTVWDPDVYAKILNGDRWRADNQIIDFHRDSHDHRKSEYVEFSDVFYSPDSDFVEGRPQLLQNVDLEVDGLTKVFDNSAGRDPLHIAYTQEVSLENSVSTAVKQAFTFDVTVGSETTVSGSYAGAELEQKLSTEIHTGFAKETERDEAENKTDSTGVAVEFDCPAGAIKKVVITKEHQRELIPVEGLFVIDFSLELKMRHWSNKGAPGLKYRQKGQDYLKAESVDGLYQIAKGVDTNYPRFAGFWQDGNACTPHVRNALLYILHPEHRTYILKTEKTRIIENNANHKVSDLDTPEHHGTSEVVDLSDEESRVSYAAAA